MSDTGSEQIENHEEASVISRESLRQSIAEKLKHARLNQSISLRDVEKTLCIRQSYLQAFESGDWSALPGEMYDIGFLRQYAKYLSCDIDELIKQLKLAPQPLTKPITYPDPPIAPSKKWMIICGITLLILLIVFNIFKPQPTLLPSHILQNKVQKVSTENKPVESNEPKAIQQDVYTSKQPHLEQVSTKPEPLKQDTKIPAQVATPTTQKHTDSNIQHHYQFTALLDKVWLQIYSVPDHRLLREALLRMGQSIHLDARKPLSITCGNLPALEVRMDQKLILQAGSVAKNKQVVHDFLLHPVAKP